MTALRTTMDRRSRLQRTALPKGQPHCAALLQTRMLLWRNLLTQLRDPQIATYSVLQPMMFVLMFRYVFGEAINTQGVSYVDYLMPGIFV